MLSASLQYLGRSEIAARSASYMPYACYLFVINTVPLQTRTGAERAKDELNGIVLHDLDLKIGWGKAVVLPPIPVYTQSGKGGLAPMLAAAKAKAASAYAAAPGLVAPAPWQAPPPVQDADPHAGAGQPSKSLDLRSPQPDVSLPPGGICAYVIAPSYFNPWTMLSFPKQAWPELPTRNNIIK